MLRAITLLGTPCSFVLNMLLSLTVVMALRIQKERLGKATFPSEREYARFFGVSRAVLEGADSEAIVMHPGPMNRGVEICYEVADGPRSVILQQAENGVAVRMAVVYLLGGGQGE